MISGFISYLNTRLESGNSETEIVLDRISSLTGETLTTAEIARFGRGIITLNSSGDGVTTFPEFCSFTGITGNTLTGVVRGLSAKGFTSVTANKRFHPVGTKVIISVGFHDFEDLLDYVDTAVAGFTGFFAPGTAGETVSAGQLVYFNLTDKEWKLCDADTAATVENVMLGIAQGAGTDGQPITDGVCLFGLSTVHSGMTVGVKQYAGNTAGALSETTGTKEVSIGIARTATNLYFNPRYDQQITEDQQDALAGSNGTPSATNKYVTQSGQQIGAEVYAADSVGTDLYAVTLSPVPAAYANGMVIHFKAGVANTGACSLNVNSLGAIDIKKNHDQDLATGDIEANQIVTVVYNSTGPKFQMQSQTASSSSADIQEFTSNDTWTKPSGAKVVEVYLFGAGGGGGSGRRDATQAVADGGGGGGGGGFTYKKFQADALGTSETVVVGTGGTGGAAKTTDGDGNIGSVGGDSTFGTNLLVAKGGGAGGAGVSGAATGGAGGVITQGDVTIVGGVGGAGGDSTDGSQGIDSTNVISARGGGGGAGFDGANPESNGGAGGGFITYYVKTGGTAGVGATATLVGGNGGAGSATSPNLLIGGVGGGGGGAHGINDSSGVNGGSGGAGGTPGGGGGGGSGKDGSYTGNSGAGAAGATGLVVIISYF